MYVVLARVIMVATSPEYNVLQKMTWEKKRCAKGNNVDKENNVKKKDVEKKNDDEICLYILRICIIYTHNLGHRLPF